MSDATILPAKAVPFDGSNWQDLQRLVTSSRMKFLQTAGLDTDPYEEDTAKCGYLTSFFTGAALDWAGQQFDLNPAIMNNFGNYVSTVRNAFGISDQGLQAQWRGQLEGLKWRPDLAVFFAEFDRLTALLNVTGHDARIALVRSKLPFATQKLLAEQALNFNNYETMRERLLQMWALDPSKGAGTDVLTTRPAKVRCSKCGKKGHAASNCRSKN
jgi:hypothetical protein